MYIYIMREIEREKW